MRVNVADEAYAALKAAGREIIVRLDGVEQQDVIWADEESGKLQRFLRSFDGKPLRIDHEWATVVLQGDVKITAIDRCPKCKIVMNGPGVEGGDCLCVEYQGPR